MEPVGQEYVTVAGMGAGPTVTVTLRVGEVPLLPVQEMEYVEVAVILETVFELEVARVPDHAPEAVQEVALVEVHERVGAVLYGTWLAEEEMEAVGVSAKVVAQTVVLVAELLTGLITAWT